MLVISKAHSALLWATLIDVAVFAFNDVQNDLWELVRGYLNKSVSLLKLKYQPWKIILNRIQGMKNSFIIISCDSWIESSFACKSYEDFTFRLLNLSTFKFNCKTRDEPRKWGMGLKKREQTMAERQALIEGWTSGVRDGPWPFRIHHPWHAPPAVVHTILGIRFSGTSCTDH